MWVKLISHFSILPTGRDLALTTQFSLLAEAFPFSTPTSSWNFEFDQVQIQFLGERLCFNACFVELELFKIGRLCSHRGESDIVGQYSETDCYSLCLVQILPFSGNTTGKIHHLKHRGDHG